MIIFHVKNDSGELNTIEVPEGINLNLMEVLKGSDYPIEATCGGMALCATCHVEILERLEQLGERSTAELDMLDTLFTSDDNSRLACQIKVDERLNDVVLRLKG
jgi:ferredoxin